MKSTIVSGFLLLSWVTVSAAGQGDFEKGISYYKQGQYDNAIEEFEKIVERTPDYESGHRILGDSYRRLKNYPKAITAFQNALRLKDNNYATYYGLALCFYNSGRYRDTAATLLRGERHARSPQDQYQLYHTRGSSYYNLKDFERAVSDLRRATSIQRGNHSDALQLGISLYHLGNLAEAESQLNTALALNPQVTQAQDYLSRLQFLRGIAAIEAQKYKEAAEILSAYVGGNPEDADAWFNLGLSQLFTTNLDTAEKSFFRSATLAPQNWQVYDRLAFIYEKKQAHAKALQNYQKAYRLNPAPQVQQSVDRVQERIRRNN